MFALRKFAPVLLGTAMVLSASSAFALNVGDSGGFKSLDDQLRTEGQTEILAAVTGDTLATVPLRIYYNEKTKTGYLAQTDTFADPANMAILMKFTEGKSSNPQSGTVSTSLKFGDKVPALLKCQQLEQAGKVKAGECTSLDSRLDAAAEDGKLPFIQAKANGYIWTAVVNTSTGKGHLYRSTTEGATITKFSFGNSIYLPKSNTLASIGPKPAGP